MQAIRRCILQRGEATTADIAAEIGLSAARTREILSEMDDVIAVGATNKRVYHMINTLNGHSTIKELLEAKEGEENQFKES